MAPSLALRSREESPPVRAAEIIRTVFALEMQTPRMTSAPCVVPGVGVEPSSPLQTRKLFIHRSGKSDKTDANAEVRYTAGTRPASRGVPDKLSQEQRQELLRERGIWVTEACPNDAGSCSVRFAIRSEAKKANGALSCAATERKARLGIFEVAAHH